MNPHLRRHLISSKLASEVSPYVSELKNLFEGLTMIFFFRDNSVVFSVHNSVTASTEACILDLDGCLDVPSMREATITAIDIAVDRVLEADL